MESVIKQNQKFYNNLSRTDQKDYIEKIHSYYNEKIPSIYYSLKSIIWNFNNLKKEQKFLIKNNNIFDIDYEIHKVEINGLHNFYNNKSIRKKYKKIYKEKYRDFLDKYLKNIHTNYLKKMLIHELTMSSFILNPVSFQNSFIKYSGPQSYHFKYIIEMVYVKDPITIIDMTPLNGNNIIGTISMEHIINQYMTVQNDKKLYKSYGKMVNDLSKDKKKYLLINENMENVYFLDKINNTNLVFIYMENIKDYNYLYNILYLPILTLILDGYLIICCENDMGQTIISEMKNNEKIYYDKTITMKTNVDMLYIIFRKKEGNMQYIFMENKIITPLTDIDTNDNPPLKIIDITFNDKTFNIVQDNILVAGTKQRATYDFFKKILTNSVENIVYASSHNGYGNVATAYGAKLLNKTAYVFLSGVQINDALSVEHVKNMRQIKTLLKLNAKIFLCQNYDIARTLKYDISTITRNKKWLVRNNFFIPEMGLHDYKTKVFSTILTNKIMIAKKNTIMATSLPINIWLVAGSGGILESIYKVFSNAHFYVFLTGFGTFYYNVLKWIKNTKTKNITILNDNKNYKLISVENDDDYNDYYKYYESVKGYDSRIWPYVKQFGKNGDYIWNVNSD